MQVLVTGCAGFIASRVCEMLLEEGHTVVGVDNLNDAYNYGARSSATTGQHLAVGSLKQHDGWRVGTEVYHSASDTHVR